MSDPFSPGPLRSRHKVTLTLLKFSLVVIVILALTGSFWWTLSITSTTRGQIFRGYRRLQEQLVSDLYEIGELSLGTSRFKELEYCSQESENYVPCFNVSENLGAGIPLRWPTGRDVIWFANVNITAQEVLSSGSLTKRMMMLDEDQISFRSVSSKFDVEDYSHQIAEIIGLRNVSYFTQAGVRTILDIECGYGSFGAHLSSHQLLTMCLANYEASGSQVQLTLERGLPAMIGSFSSKQLPYSSLSFDMIHCARCHIDWDKKAGSPSLCSKGHDIESPYYRPLQSCIGGTQSRRWVPIEERRKWPSLAKLNSAERAIHGLHSEEFADDAINWNSAVRNYWSLLSPLIFSDHPKRPGDEDPSPPYNMLRNVLDMNARFGGFNAALLETGNPYGL
ncbi:UNVERIFIED_CONTAM: putative pectin methyltransferase QUA2 [Sesamum radiatum]|uniref:Methyltransferase n=1 Tax=Sesamum radiatum TaxID=300843 RepID=A0AAW2QEU8_SESRA